MTAGFFSPMPPARTGVADYSAALLAEMRKLGDVRLNQSGEVGIYHIGNNQLHRPIYQRALAEPGLIVLHDAVLQHFFLGSLDEAAYVEEFVYNYGPWTAGLASRLWRNRARSGSAAIYFEYPMLKRVVERSLGAVVHNRAAAEIVRMHVPTARVFEIPHLFLDGPQPAEYDVIRLRARMGLRPSDTLFGVFGHLRESKRLTAVLDGFGQLRRAGERVALLVAGDFVSSDLARNVRPLLNGSGILRVGYTPERTFWLYANAVDACINLRYPTAGETSGIAVRLMGIGKPVLLTAGNETADIPDAAAIRIHPGTLETDMLSEYMLWLTRFPADARAIGALARQHICTEHAGARVAAAYWKALAECRGR